MAMTLGRSQFSAFTGNEYGEHFPNPFVDVSSLSMPGAMRTLLYWCMPPGTLVEGDGLSQSPIETVQPGNRVLTGGGTSERVVAISKRQHSGDLVNLCFAGLGGTAPQQMTPDHRVWRIRTARLKPGRVHPDLSRAEKVPASEVAVGDYVATPLPRRPSYRTARFDGRLLGLYVAEGCFYRDADRLMGIRFTLGAGDEASGVLDSLRQLVIDAVDQDVAPYTPPSRPDVRILSVSDPEMPDWMYAHGGCLAKEKKLSADVLAYGDEFIRRFIGGWIDGDGWIDAAGMLHGCTSSRVLAYQVIRLANCVGLTPSLVVSKNRKGFGKKNGKPSYNLTFDKQDSVSLIDCCIKAGGLRKPQMAKRRGCFVSDGYVFRRVVSTSRVAYEGPVYNLEVENDHTFVANGVLTSNCEFIYSQFGTYRMAMERIISYFLTDVEILKVSQDEKEKWNDFLDTTVDTITVLQNLLRDRMAYGNAFASVYVPFKRFLGCPNRRCGAHFPLREVYDNNVFRFQWQLPDFTATCPVCQTRGKWRVDDRPEDNEKKIKVKRWSPHEIEILHCPFSHDNAYIWRIPEQDKLLVKKGHLYHLERVPKEVLKAIHRNEVYRFDDEAIYHMKEPTLAGILNRGWGLPRIFSNFRQIYYVQVLRRFNEAIALDYVIPFRLITPGLRQGSSAGGGISVDPLMMYNGGDFRGQVMRMIRGRRRDPASWQVLPFPVNYQLLGGDANKLAPRDLLDQGTETLLNDAGTPVELYKGSLQLQTAPVALRLFETTWHHLVHDANDFLRWMVKQVGQILSWEVVDARLKRTTIADDAEKQMQILQLYMSQQMSGRSAFGVIGHNWEEEQKRIAEEARIQAEIQARNQEEMEQAGWAQSFGKGQAAPPGGAAPPGAPPGAAPAPGGAAPPGGAPQGGAPAQPSTAGVIQAGGGMAGPVSTYLQSMSPQVPQSPEDLMAVADQLANELLGMPEGTKDSELRKLKQANPVLHSIVKEKLTQIRRDTRSQAGNQAMAQMQQGGGGGMM